MPYKAKIEKADDFDKIFGMAAGMGPGRQPTNIDFSKHYVIAIALDETDTATIIAPMSLQKNEAGDIVFKYKVEKAAKVTYKMGPMLAIIIDKANDGKIIFEEQE